MPDHSEQERKHLGNIFDCIERQDPTSFTTEINVDELLVTEKVKQLPQTPSDGCRFRVFEKQNFRGAPSADGSASRTAATGVGPQHLLSHRILY